MIPVSTAALWALGIFTLSTMADPPGFFSEEAQRNYGRQLSHFGEYFVLMLLLHWAVVGYGRTRATRRPIGVTDRPTGATYGPTGVTYRPTGLGKGQTGATPAAAVYRPSGLPMPRSPARPAGQSRHLSGSRSAGQRRGDLDTNIRTAAALALAIALMDEAYQGLVAERQFEVKDLLFDASGVVAAIALIVVVRSLLTWRSATQPKGGIGNP